MDLPSRHCADWTSLRFLGRRSLRAGHTRIAGTSSHKHPAKKHQREASISGRLAARAASRRQEVGSDTRSTADVAGHVVVVGEGNLAGTSMLSLKQSATVRADASTATSKYISYFCDHIHSFP